MDKNFFVISGFELEKEMNSLKTLSFTKFSLVVYKQNN